MSADTVYFGPNGEEVQFSREASVQYFDTVHSAFQRHSYIAKVFIPGDDVPVIVSLPRGAAVKREADCVAEAVERARDGHSQGSHLVMCP